jgi:hypothetical protein
MMLVKYIGDATVRIITNLQWEDEGVEDQETVSWSLTNQYTVADTELSENAVAVLARDPMMIFLGSDRDPEEELEARIALAQRRMRERAARASTAS